MGHFAGNIEGLRYETTWCVHCVHDATEEGCAVLRAHILGSSDETRRPESPLHRIIPIEADGSNGACLMFLRRPIGPALVVPIRRSHAAAAG